MIDLSVIIVSYNVRDLLDDCLDSLRNDPEISFDHSRAARFQGEVVVIDSASGDATIELVHRKFPWVKTIEPGANVGFSKGNNIGIDASTGRYIFLLNPDTRVIGSAISELLKYLEVHPDYALIGPCLLNKDGSIQPSRRRFPTLATAIFESTFLQDWGLSPRCVLDRFYVADKDPDHTHEVDWVTGAAMLVRRDVVEKIGMFDDQSFFMYSEELDWQFRMSSAGLKVAFCPSARIVHFEAQSSNQTGALKYVRFNESKVKFYRKHHGAGKAWFLQQAILGLFAIAWCLEAMKWLLRHKPSLRAERMDIYEQVLQSGLRG
jgi:GT2 family glycosyltransferase